MKLELGFNEFTSEENLRIFEFLCVYNGCIIRQNWSRLHSLYGDVWSNIEINLSQITINRFEGTEVDAPTEDNALNCTDTSIHNSVILRHIRNAVAHGSLHCGDRLVTFVDFNEDYTANAIGVLTKPVFFAIIDTVNELNR